MRLQASIAFAAVLLMSSPALAQVAGMSSDVYGLQQTDVLLHGGFSASAPRFPAPGQQYARRLANFRAEALKARVADGGALTTAHREALQARLDDLNAEFHQPVH